MTTAADLPDSPPVMTSCNFTRWNANWADGPTACPLEWGLEGMEGIAIAGGWVW